MNRKHFIMATLFAVVLLTVAFTPTSSQQERTYNPWVDTNDDGMIDGKDIAAIAKLFGTSGTPVNKTALIELDRRVGNIEEYLNETTTVELLRASTAEGAPYYYYYGVSGHWNITKLQTEPFKEELNSTLDGALMYCDAYDNTYCSLQPEGKGYTQLINMAIGIELDPTEIEEVRLLIKSYLAHL